MQESRSNSYPYCSRTAETSVLPRRRRQLGHRLARVAVLPAGRLAPLAGGGEDGEEELAGQAAVDLRDLLRLPAATPRPPRAPPRGPMSTRWSAALITSRLCSMTRTVLPASTRRWRTSSRRR